MRGKVRNAVLLMFCLFILCILTGYAGFTLDRIGSLGTALETLRAEQRESDARTVRIIRELIDRAGANAAGRRETLTDLIDKLADQTCEPLIIAPAPPREPDESREADDRGPQVQDRPVPLAELFARGEYARCFQTADALVANDPSDTRARFYRGASLFRMNPADSDALDAARHDLRVVLEGDPSRSRAYLLLGEIALEQGNRDQALRFLSTYTQLSPHEAEGYLLLGAARLAAGGNERGVADLHKARELSAPDDELYSRAGVLLEQAEGFPEGATQ